MKCTTHKEITVIATKWLKKHRNNIVIPNCRTVASEISSNVNSGEIPDLIGWCSWTSILIEVKISRNDFLKDNKKLFRKMPTLGMGEFRYFICPKDLIKIEEIPEDWGLLYFDENEEIKTEKLAKRQKANLEGERTILLSLLSRV